MLPWAQTAIAIRLVTPRALATDPRASLDLRWKVAPECPDRDAAALAITALVSEPVRHRVAINVEIARTEDGRFAARIEAPGSEQGARREFEGDDCGRVTDAVVLIVAMMLDPVATADRVTPAPTHEPPLRVSIGTRAAADVGSLPAPSAGAGFALGLHSQRLPSRPAPKAAGSDSLAREVQILRDARAELKDGKAEKALNLLDRHAELHPRGTLAEEQLAARALALCSLGRIAEARGVMAELERIAPRSPHLLRVKSSCGKKPD